MSVKLDAFKGGLILKKKFNLYDGFFVVPIVFFALSLVNVTLGVLGLICAVTPFVLVYKKRDTVWCKSYCPRAGFFTKVFRKISLNKKAPNWLYTQKTKRFVQNFFCVNLMMMTMSTVMVALGKMPPMDYVRFLMAFPVPMELPQLIQFSEPDALLHFSYRIFSIMFTSTVIGSVMGLLYRPRSWCGICPVQTLTKTMIKNLNEVDGLHQMKA